MGNKDGRILKNITLGSVVQVVLKENQQNGHLTKGRVQEILTNAPKHPHGIKVKLKSGKVGRVRKILSINKEEVIAEEKTGPIYNVPFLN